MQVGRELDALVAEHVFGIILKNTFTGEESPITSGIALIALHVVIVLVGVLFALGHKWKNKS